MNKLLTPKQEAFCQAYIQTGNKSEAYRMSYNCSKIKLETIESKSQKLFDNDSIKKRIEELNKNKAGRPTLYKQEYDEQARKLCLLGATDKSLADFFSVVESTINLWKIEHPSFSESIRAGKDLADMEVAESLYKTTKDRTIPSQQAFKVKNVYYNEEGKRVESEEVVIVDVMQGVAANDRSIQFWLKNRKSEYWREKQEIDHTTNGESMNTSPPNLSNLSIEELQLLKKITTKQSDEQ